MVLLEDGESRFILLKRWTEPSASPDFPVWTIPNSPKSQVTSEEEGVAISCSRGSPDLGIEPLSLASPALAGRFFTAGATWEAPIRKEG